MVVGFFSDDGSAQYAALLTSCGLASVNRPMLLVDGSNFKRPTDGSTVPEAVPTHADIVAELASARNDGFAEIALVAPLAFLDDPGMTAELDVAVVSGSDPLQERRAGRCADRPFIDARTRRAVSQHVGVPAMSRPWFLRFGGRRCRPAGVSVGFGPQQLGAIPVVRTLPVEVPLRGRTLRAAMENGLPTLETLRIGILLVASLEVAAADTDVTKMEPAAMAALMSPQPHPQDRALARRLTELADRLEAVEHALTRRDSSRPHLPESRGCQRRQDGRTPRAVLPGRSAGAGQSREVAAGER